jgi:hypothetical protein
MGGDLGIGAAMTEEAHDDYYAINPRDGGGMVEKS